MTALLRERAETAPPAGYQTVNQLKVEVRGEPPPPFFDPNIYEKDIEVTGMEGRIHTLRVLDTKCDYVSADGGTARFRRWILGHSAASVIPTSLKIQGWQGDETYVEFYRIRLENPDGRISFITQQIDLHSPHQNR